MSESWYELPDGPPFKIGTEEPVPMSEPRVVKINKLTHSTYMLGSPERLGRVAMDASTTKWHCLQLFSFRLLIAWPSRRLRPEYTESASSDPMHLGEGPYL